MDRIEQAMTPLDPDYAARVRTSFGHQQTMALLGGEMTEVGPGMTEIVLPSREELTQQHGFVHAGIITAIVDSACGYAALSLMPPGRTIMVCTGYVVAERADSTQQTVALMQATMMVVRDRATVSD